MPFLVIDGETILVAPSQAPRQVIEIGDKERAFSGTLRSTIRARKREWDVTTVPMPQADADALEAVLEGTPPLTCSGDLLGGDVDCHIELQGSTPLRLNGEEYSVLQFRVLEE